MTEHPRVLHVGFNPIGSPSNTGLTLASMFGAWPGDRLFEVYTRSRQASARVENTLIAPATVAPVDGAVRALLGRRLPPPLADGLNNSVSRKGRQLDLRTRARIAATTLNDIGPVLVRGSWMEEIEAFSPQVIHSLLGSVRVTKIVTALAERLDVPVVPHFMDDWPSTMFADDRLLGLPRREVARLLGRVLERSPLCLAIGHDMAEEFRRRYDRPCVVVGNSVDFATYRSVDVTRRDDRAEGLTLRYVGGLHLGRAEVLARLAGVLDATARAWRLAIHAPQADARLLGRLEATYSSVVAGPTVRPDQVPALLVGSGALLFIESTDPAIHAFTRLSVSTKVPEYLATGRPVLVIGPGDQASARALLGSEMGWYGGDGNPGETLDGALGRLAAQIDAGTRYVDRTAEETFDAGPTRDRLREALAGAAAR